METSIIQIVDQEHLNAVKNLFKAYFKELDENICFQNFEEELQDPLKLYFHNQGALFVAFYNQEPVACIALKNLGNDTCEMKRLFVLPSYRKKGIAEKLCQVLLQKAKELGYKNMKLDTLPKLKAAIALYQKLGFKITQAYYNNPLAGVVYMQNEL